MAILDAIMIKELNVYSCPIRYRLISDDISEVIWVVSTELELLTIARSAGCRWSVKNFGATQVL